MAFGNPLWERIKLREQEFLASHDRENTEAPNKAARERLLKDLPMRKPALAVKWVQAKHGNDAEFQFVRASGRFPLTAVGDVDTYALFATDAKARHFPTYC